MISLEAILLLGSGLVTTRALNFEFLWPMVDSLGRTLIFDTIFLLAFLLYILLGRRGQKTARTRFWLVATVCLWTMTILVTRQWQNRSSTVEPYPIQDGAVQTEAAAKFLLQGINPYQADYQPTRFGYFPSPAGRDHPNVAWTHYAYAPGNVLLAVPIVWLKKLGSTVDVSLIYCLALIAAVVILVTRIKDWNYRTRLVLLTLGNPYLWFYPVAGFNDVVFVLGLIGAAAAISSRRWTIAGLAFAAALFTKQTAWLTIPLWIWWLWRLYRQANPVAKTGPRRALWVSAVATVVAYAPFVLWNARAFYDDAIRYVSGAIPWSYPIAGSTMLQWLRVGRLIPSEWSMLPHTLIMLAVAAPTLWLTGRWISSRPTSSQWLLGCGVVIFTTMLFNRFFLENYIAALYLLFVAVYALHQTEQQRPA